MGLELVLRFVWIGGIGTNSLCCELNPTVQGVYIGKNHEFQAYKIHMIQSVPKIT
jgi:hypothetical protein